MIWRRFTIQTTTEAEDILAANLAELGIEGVQIEDRIPLSQEDTKGMFIDILPDIGPDNGEAEVSFYVEVLNAGDKQERLLKAEMLRNDPSVDASYIPNTANVYTEEELQTVLDQVREVLEEMRLYCEVGKGEITVSNTEDKDWVNNWKTFFHPFTVDDILIKPTWEEIPEADKDKLLIQIDPGTAFGTGMHETTQLCIRQLKKYMKPGDRVADIGTGSGILGITALKLGAGEVTGTDLDEEAIPAVADNMQVNQLEKDRFTLHIGNVIGDDDLKTAMGRQSYDVVVANILAPVIVLLTKDAAELVKKDGIFITSGILDERKPEVMAAFEEKPELWEVLEVNQQGEWVNITAKRR